MELKCSCCQKIKDVSLFPKATKKKRGYAWECKSCKATRRKQKQESMSAEDWALQNRKYWLQSQYGMSVEEYNNRLKEQNHKCGICFADEVDVFKQTLYVDHCHTTNKIRGLLCHACNTALGLFKDNEQVLEQAKIYLKGNTNG